MMIKYHGHGKLRVVSDICRRAIGSCDRTYTPQMNCIKLGAFIRKGRLDGFPEDPGSHFIHWAPTLQHAYEQALQDQERTTESEPVPTGA